ncbi:MAG TPA: LacI family DNA-binding transcriptional regulator [Kouleothrix sp.]|uniref:LacI family DNA-binding transcriptional regulator n=1 Tax=Kouleothrix sp. TaxID=2779161 RepID=UPI002B53B294|nr:LacI family DNA-binding transcriptional regulator [Kouleothrix sp.]HRC76995.1 LacI family DNA-binding transcriptional regulator [Kouleothrix sp.]
MAVTINEVAEHAGVSPMTVSRVINGSQRVRAETRTRVEQAIAELGYVPNSLARGLSRQKAGTLALIVPDVANPFFTLIVRGAENVARRAGYRVILCNTESDLEREHEYVQEMLAHRVEGILIAPANDRSLRHMRIIQRHGVPFVLLDRAVAGMECDLVQGDSVGSARQLVEHLVRLGHSRIALLGGEPEISTTRDRVQGYRQGLQGAGLAWDPALEIHSRYEITGGYQAAQRMLELPTLPTALLAVNNVVAVGVVLALRERGLEVPRDFALACFDDIEYASLLFPFLTAMVQPAESFGTLATQLLLDRIDGRGSEQRRHVVLASELIVRASCGSNRVAMPSLAQY